MFIIIVVIIGMIAVLLTLIILLQSGKGGGLAGIAAGGATTQILGARQAPDILEKATWTLATAFIVLCILSNFAITTEDRERSVIQQRAAGTETEQPVPVVPPLEQPAPGQQPAPQDDN
jgi:preprotein translocase subunit SecG